MTRITDMTAFDFRNSVRQLVRLVGIPFGVCALLLLVGLYALGGTDLIRFALAQLTLKLLLKIAGAILGLALFTWLRHVGWYQDERSPMWLRRSLLLNVGEILLLCGLIIFAVWAIPRFVGR